jgi:hypothetical protein
MCAYIIGAAPNRWGFTSDGCDSNTLIKPIPPELSGRLSLMFQLKCIGCKEIIAMLTMSLIPQCHLLIKWVIKGTLLC